ncbi:MAG: hypothetical protein QXG65_03260 [Thermoplasmata archaeon]
MALVRRIRRRGSSGVLTIPMAVMDMLELTVGDSLSPEVVGKDTILLRVVRTVSPAP